MAKVTGGTDGSISGAIGPVVFYKLRGKSYARRRPDRSKDTWSATQKTYFSKFGKVALFWRQNVPVKVKQIFQLAAEGMTGYNLFLKTNLPAFNADGTEIDLQWLHLSAGKLPLPHKLEAKKMTGDPSKVEVSWQDDSDTGLALPKDELMIIVADGGKYKGPSATGALRSQGTALIQLPSGIGNLQGIYLSFASEQRELYSPDQFFGI